VASHFQLRNHLLLKSDVRFQALHLIVGLLQSEL
jgi:hypothetical protein